MSCVPMSVSWMVLKDLLVVNYLLCSQPQTTVDVTRMPEPSFKLQSNTSWCQR